MHVLVTGGAGFIGSHLVDALLARGDQVTILDSLVERVHPGGRVPEYVPTRANLIRDSVTEKSAWERSLNGVQAVVHLAAYQDYQPDFSQFALVNEVGTALLYETAVELDLALEKVVVASSQAVYGEGTYRCSEHGVQYPPPRPLAQLERGDWQVVCPVCGDPVQPLATPERRATPHNAYAISKVAQEHYSLVLGRRYEIPTAALRFSIVQGARQSPANAYSGILRAFTGRLLRRQPPVVFEDGAQLRDYTHVADAVAAILVTLDDPRADFEIFNVGSGRTVTVLEYARALSARLGADLEPEVGGRFRVGDVHSLWSDTSKLEALGWRATRGLNEIHHDYLAWFDPADADADWVGRAIDAMESSGSLRRAHS